MLFSYDSHGGVPLFLFFVPSLVFSPSTCLVCVVYVLVSYPVRSALPYFFFLSLARSFVAEERFPLQDDGELGSHVEQMIDSRSMI